MKISEWAKLLEKAYSNKHLTCPECGGEVSAHLFANSDKRGFALLKCNKCNALQEFSRVKFPDYAKTEKL